MLVVMGLVDRVAMLSVQVVEVVQMCHCIVTTVRLVHVHVGAVREVVPRHGFVAARQLVDVVSAGTVDATVVEEVDVIPVWHEGVATPAVMIVLMARYGQVFGIRLGWRHRVVHTQDGSRVTSGAGPVRAGRDTDVLLGLTTTDERPPGARVPDRSRGVAWPRR